VPTATCPSAPTEPAAGHGDGKLELSPLGARLAERLTFEEWLAIGTRLIRYHDASVWWIGDWLAYGEWRYREKYKTVVAQLEMSYDRVRDYAYVARNVRPRYRRSELTFTHHRYVAKLSPAEQESWLTRAADGRWTTRRLADELARGDGTGGPQPDREKLLLNVDPDRAAAWRRAALGRGLDFVTWVTSALDAAARDDDGLATTRQAA
jgi:hypothetical protein